MAKENSMFLFAIRPCIKIGNPVVAMANTGHAVTIHAMDGKSTIIAVSGCSSASQWYVVHLQPSKTDRE
jgi:Ni,Fe-hydrogenase I small subunit